MKVTIQRSIEAEQWLGEHGPLPEGAHLCKPEIHWSADRSLVYFTYAELMPRHWMEVIERPGVGTSDELNGFESGTQIETNDGRQYWRKILPFTFYSVKSEASMTNNHRAVYLEKNNEEYVRLFVDYVYVEGWTNPIPPRAEYREIDGSYGRGFRLVYMKPGDWLIKEEVPDGHDNLGYKTLRRVISDSEFHRMKRG